MNPFSSQQPFDPREQGADRRVVDAKESVQDEWLELPGVHGVGVYRDDGADIIEVWVDPDAADSAPSLPQTVRGIPVTVRLAKPPVLSAAPAKAGSQPGALFDENPAPQVNDQRYDPLIGGISIAAYPAVPQRGTLGVIVRDPGSGNHAHVLLTNWHVLTAGGTVPGTSAVVQPGNSQQQQDIVGNGVRGYLGNIPIPVNGVDVYVGIDVAVGSTVHRNSTPDTVLGLQGIVASGANPYTGLAVAKCGITTGVTHGLINHVNQVCTVVYGGVTHRLDNQFGIQSANHFFSDSGDSGSLILTASTAGPAAVGMLWGHDNSTAPGRLSWASPSLAIAHYLQNT